MNAAASGGLDAPPPQFALLDLFFPGFSAFSGAVEKYFKVDLNLYIPLVLFLGGVTFAWRYFSEYFWCVQVQPWHPLPLKLKRITPFLTVGSLADC